MIVTTAAPLQLVPSASNFGVDLTLDMNAKVINVIVRNPDGGRPFVDSAPIPAALQTALQNYAQRRAEVLLGVANGSTTVA